VRPCERGASIDSGLAGGRGCGAAGLRGSGGWRGHQGGYWHFIKSPPERKEGKCLFLGAGDIRLLVSLRLKGESAYDGENREPLFSSASSSSSSSSSSSFFSFLFFSFLFFF
jgi:hypothetical protein